jgi:hypothetical protein
MHLRYMAEREGMTADLEGINVVGQQIAEYRKEFKAGFEALSERYPQVTIVTGESACTGCTTELVTALTYLDKEGYSPEMSGLQVVIGDVETVSPASRVAVIERCAVQHAHLGAFAEGCAPSEERVVRVLCEACGVDVSRVLEVRDRVRAEMWESSRKSLES